MMKIVKVVLKGNQRSSKVKSLNVLREGNMVFRASIIFKVISKSWVWKVILIVFGFLTVLYLCKLFGGQIS